MERRKAVHWDDGSDTLLHNVSVGQVISLVEWLLEDCEIEET